MTSAALNSFRVCRTSPSVMLVPGILDGTWIVRPLGRRTMVRNGRAWFVAGSSRWLFTSWGKSMRALCDEKRVEWRIGCSWMDVVLENEGRRLGGGDQKHRGVLRGAGDAGDGNGGEGGVGSIGPGDVDGEGHVFISSSIAGSGMVAYKGRVWDGGDEKQAVIVVVRVFNVENVCL